MLSFLALLLLGAGCRAPDPRAPLVEVVGDVAAKAPEGSVWIAVLPDAIDLGTVGPWTQTDDADIQRSLEESFQLELVDGRIPEEQTRGRLISPVYEVLLSYAETLKDLDAHTDAPVGFHGDIWLFVDRRTHDDTLTKVMFSAGQAQFGNMHVVGLGPRQSAPEEGVAEPTTPPTPWERPTPLSPVRHGLVGGRHTFTIDDRPATFRLEVPEQAGFTAVRPEGIVAAATAEPSNPHLFGTYTEAAEHARYPVLPSFEMLLHVAKDTDDRLLVAATRGREDQRQRWIEDAAASARDANRPAAASFLETAAALGRGERPREAQNFLAHAIESKPVGVYAEHDDLSAVFRRDRWLMQKLVDEPMTTELVQQLSDDPFLREEDDIRAIWTNPPDPMKPRLSDSVRPTWIIPGARSHETELVNALGGASEVPDPMDAFVEAIRAGSVDLTPREDSGWYDRQQWALEPLLTLPDDKITANDGYRKRLRRAFEAAVTMRRETAVKDLSLPAIGAGMASEAVFVAPALRVEPLPTAYARHAQAYRWSSQHLPAHQPPEVAEQVRTETARLATFFSDLSAISRVDLGMPVDGLPVADPAPIVEEEGQAANQKSVEPLEALIRGAEGSLAGLSMATEATDPPIETEATEPIAVDATDVTATADWLQDWSADPALSSDVRVFVPVGEEDDGIIVGWALLGVHAIDLVVAYEHPPTVTFLGPKQRVRRIEARYSVLVPMFAELRTRRVWARAELREVADQHPTAIELVEALESAR